jgi:hypothetical protein
LSACGPDEGPPADEAPELLAQAACAEFFACDCDPAEVGRVEFSSPQACEAEVTTFIADLFEENDRAGGRYDASCTQQTLNVVTEHGAPACPASAVDLPDCKFFSGASGEGDACTSHYFGDDCEASLACVPDPDREWASFCQRLDARPAPPQGEPCDAACGDEMRCTDGTCAPQTPAACGLHPL